jgi:divalent metal cation (Fe/Co/Zn/Cd) transporter
MGSYSLVDFHITVDPKSSVTSGHQIAERARTQILSLFPQIREALIHVEGNTQLTPMQEFKLMTNQSTVIREIHNAIESNSELSHKITHSDNFVIHYLGEKIEVIFSIQLNGTNTIDEATNIAKELKTLILKEIPYITNVIIKLELSV